MPIIVPPVATVTVDMVKERLNKTLAVDDAEIQDMIDAAEAEYAKYVGPLSGSVTERLDGGSDCLVLRSPNVASLTSAAYADGTTIDVDDLELDTTTGIVYWGYNTAGRFSTGCRNVTITYTVASIPANHLETIVADVAGYFQVTQNGGSDARFPGEDFAEAGYTGTPQVLFPRIRALAPPRVA